MPNIQVITPTAHAGKRWQRFNSYHFAAGDAIIPLVIQELPRATLSLPIAFVVNDDKATLVAVQGLQPGKNLLVGAKGQWLGGYVPAAYRSYPFLLGATKEGRQVLCIDEESGLVSNEDGEVFFGEDGQAGEALAKVLDFLTRIAAGRQATARLCAVLLELRLLQPWPIKIQGSDGERALDGLWRIDESVLNSLDEAAFAVLRRAGALPVIYCQLLSMQQLQRLGQLATAHARNSTPADLSSFDIETLFGGPDDTIKFNA